MAKRHEYPVGVAQSKVLHALGITHIETFQAAERYFDSIGISVIPVREGKTSVPSIRIKNTRAYWNERGDADVVDAPTLTPAQREALKQWIDR